MDKHDNTMQNNDAKTLDEIYGLIDRLHALTPYKDSIGLLNKAYKDAKLEQKYQRALWLREEAETEDDFEELAKDFSSLGYYKDSESLADEAKQSARKAAEAARVRRLKNVLTTAAVILLTVGLCYGAYRLEIYRENMAILRAQEEERAAIKSAMCSFFEGRNDEAQEKLLERLKKSYDIIFSDMLAILNYAKNSSQTYSKQNIEVTKSELSSEAEKLALEYANKGSVNANVFLGDMYMLGINGVKDENKALLYYSVAAESGDVYAKVSAADIHQSLQDNEKALELYNEAVELGDTNAEKAAQGLELKTKYLKDAQQGNAEAQMTLAEMYENGETVIQDYDEALKWYTEAAPKIPEAKTRSGVIYYNVKNDYVKARENFAITAKLGDPVAQYYIGLMFERGQVVNVNYSQAAEWYKKAANQGHEEAAVALQRVERIRAASQRSIRGTYVNLRELPNTNSESLEKLDEGTPVEIIKEINTNGEKWYQVKLQSNKTGYVHSDYIQNFIGTKGIHGGEYKAVNGDEVNLRSGPGRSYSKVTKLYDGKIVELLEERTQNKETWCRVFTLDGQQGWILKRYIRDRKIIVQSEADINMDKIITSTKVNNAKYRIVINKSNYTLSLLNGDELVKNYSVAVGKNAGDKERVGDNRTPVGNSKSFQSRMLLRGRMIFKMAKEKSLERMVLGS